MSFSELLNSVIFRINDYELTVYELLAAIAVLVITRIALYIVRLFLRRAARKVDPADSRHHSIYLLIKYFGWTIGIILAINTLGVSVGILLASSAALFVGLGFGLQTTFQDLISGIIILVEHNIKINDVVEVDGLVAQVREIGLRTSKIETRDDITMIVPNRKFVDNNIINWSHSKRDTRFHIDLGVSYKSDPEKVREVLMDCASNHDNILTKKGRMPFVRFSDYGDSSINFSLFFFSQNAFRIEHTKSELRFKIFKKLKEAGIEIPFPQNDVYIKSMPKPEK